MSLEKVFAWRYRYYPLPPVVFVRVANKRVAARGCVRVARKELKDVRFVQDGVVCVRAAGKGDKKEEVTM